MLCVTHINFLGGNPLSLSLPFSVLMLYIFINFLYRYVPICFDVWWWLKFYGHFCSHGKLNGPNNPQRLSGEVKDETTFRHTIAGIWTKRLYLFIYEYVYVWARLQMKMLYLMRLSKAKWDFTISEGCLIFDFASSPLEVTRPI